MYHFNDSLTLIPGIGDKKAAILKEQGISNVLDFLLNIPIRYEDRSKLVTIDELNQDELATFKARVIKTGQFYRNRKTIVTATIEDSTGKINCIWFNNKFIKNRLKNDREYFFSGKLSKNRSIVQAVVEDIKDDVIHTGRLVPIYSSTLGLKQGNLRRLFNTITNNLSYKEQDSIANIIETKKLIDHKLPSIEQIFQLLHFPEKNEDVVVARERLAIEELVNLIKKSHSLKASWLKDHNSQAITVVKDNEDNINIKTLEKYIPTSIPYTLTNAQKKAVIDILIDIQKNTPMNRLLIGDVGSGKTVVAGVACFHTLKNKQNVTLIAPTQILANHHYDSFKKLFPKMNIELLTAATSKNFRKSQHPTLYIGTHALINRLEEIEPQFVVYDEQHRFGVSQRSVNQDSKNQPHTLTMSATPIPRSMMLSIFSHLDISVIDEMPPGRIPTTTWLTPIEKKRKSQLWILDQLSKDKKNTTALFVCPFIKQSKTEGFSEIAAAKPYFTELNKNVEKYNKDNKSNLTIELLHSKLKKTKKEEITSKLFSNKINILVTTPVIEVGLDLPSANIIVIESAERYGLASLHQLRGRVGRAGQSSFCLLFTSKKEQIATKRLSYFSKTDDGIQLAEYDLKNRGPGNLFGTQQHGFSNLRFASWTNFQLVATARKVTDDLLSKSEDWISFLPIQEETTNIMAN